MVLPRAVSAKIRVLSGRRRGPRTSTYVFLLGLAFCVLHACSDDAVGVDTCRRIETARCHAAQACGELSDADRCERFYRDHCLHGFAGLAPGKREADSCVEALDEVAECARSGSCEPRCDAVQTPGVLAECAFLADDGEDEDENDDNEGSTGGAGGAAGSDDQPAGASGAAGASE